MPVEQECTEQVGTKTTVNKFIGCCGGTVHSGRTELSPHCGLWHLGPMVEAGCDKVRTGLRLALTQQVVYCLHQKKLCSWIVIWNRFPVTKVAIPSCGGTLPVVVLCCVCWLLRGLAPQ